MGPMFRGVFILMITSCALATVPAFALVERRVERRFEVPEAAALNVDTFSGEVRITEDPNARVIEVVVLQSADVATDAAMDARLASLSLEMSQRNGAVSLTARYAKSVGWSWKSWAPVNLVYEIKVPRRCDVQVTTRDGAILMGSLEGRVVLGNESGSIFTGEITGPVTAHSVTGGVSITAATGAIDVSTRTSNIVIGRAFGPTRISSQGGYIEVQQAGDELVIRGSGSSAQVGFARQFKHAADIAVSGGEIMLVLETNRVCTLDLKSSIFGKVNVRGELPLNVTTGSVGRSSLEATVNGGGPRITARASGGNVVVRSVRPLLAPADDDSSLRAD